jgi:hypothetical protein
MYFRRGLLSRVYENLILIIPGVSAGPALDFARAQLIRNIAMRRKEIFPAKAGPTLNLTHRSAQSSTKSILLFTS